MEIIHKRIFDFKDHEYIPAHHDPKEPGYYMTIRCGLSGIYTQLDEWKNNKWQVGIKVNYKQIFLGYYDTLEKAIEVRKQAEIKYFGEYRNKS